jgi:deazaflavin-dependent oxidoreductase (nitroreductase family)
MDENLLRRIFWYLNKYLMAPAFRLGLGPLMGNPFTGYIMVLKTTGRKTGRQRYTPVNYAILDGKVYCLAGFGKLTHWYRNLQAEPRLELILPGGALMGAAEEVADRQERLAVTRQVLKNGGFAGYFFGFSPHSVADEVLDEATKEIPVIRISPTGIGSSPTDPGGWSWVLAFGLMLWPILHWISRRLKKDSRN